MADLDQKIDELRAEMREGFREVRAEFKNVRSEAKDVRAKMQAGFKDIRSEVNGVRTEINGVRGEVREGFKDVRADGHAEVVELRSDINARFAGMERLATALWVSLTGGMAAFVAALIATNL